MIKAQALYLALQNENRDLLYALTSQGRANNARSSDLGMRPAAGLDSARITRRSSTQPWITTQHARFNIKFMQSARWASIQSDLIVESTCSTRLCTDVHLGSWNSHQATCPVPPLFKQHTGNLCKEYNIHDGAFYGCCLLSSKQIFEHLARKKSYDLSPCPSHQNWFLRGQRH